MIKSGLIGISLLIISLHSGATSEERSPKTITFEGVLLANSPYPNIGCGGVWFHQLARYRVEKVLKGTYRPKELVVDHAACWGDVFQGIPVGSRVRLTVMVRKNYHTITTYPGIREIVDVENLSDAPRVFYVSLDPPQKVGVQTLEVMWSAAAEQSLAADGAIACFPSNLVPLGWMLIARRS